MPYADMLLHMPSYPDPMPTQAIDQAVDIAARLGKRLTAEAVRIQIPVHSNPVAEYLLDLTQMAKDEEAKSAGACKASLEYFRAAARQAGLASATLVHTCDLYVASEHLGARARTRDLTIVPLWPKFDDSQAAAQAAIFDSGRPALILRPDVVRPGDGLGKVAVAWDGSRSAARALADAMPALTEAREVRVVTIVGEKATATGGLAAPVLRHLAEHGITAHADEVDGLGQSIGHSLDTYIDAQVPDLLVMGAYGHSRLREFVLGGATEHMLWHAKAPVMLSH